jgi:hypothetical protein
MIIHKTPQFPNYEGWRIAYNNELCSMFEILTTYNNIEQSQSNFTDFCDFIWSQSSKFISPYI